MNDYWHIPRASLASSSTASSSASSSNRSNKAHSNPPTVVKRTPPPQTPLANNFAPNYGKAHGDGGEYRTTEVGGSRSAVALGSRDKRVRNTRRDSEISRTSAAVTAAAAAAVLAAAKRGSRSSQGSSDSNNSTRSAASGSLLLTAANLERFAEIHKKQEKHHKLYLADTPSVHNTKIATPRTAYNANLIHATTPTATAAGHNNNGDDVIITMDPNLDFIKTKDLDTVSIASSMHFTMVNGEGGPPKKPKRGLCDRGRQVTVLIVSMSTIFLLLIMGMVYALEMRAREMPQS